MLASSQLAAALRRQHVPAERHERPLQQHGHAAAGAAAPPAARPLRAALPPAQLPVRQPGLLQLLHHEELLLRRGPRPGGSAAPGMPEREAAAAAEGFAPSVEQNFGAFGELLPQIRPLVPFRHDVTPKSRLLC